jgi:hypothetical protein
VVFILVITYQSTTVLKILKSNKIYRAHRNFRFDKAYSALSDILDLDCECPVFGCLALCKKRFDGKVSSSKKLLLNVPKKHLKLTEFSVWADFLYCQKFTKPKDYTAVATNTDEVQQRFLDTLMVDLRIQRRPSSYNVPQVIMKEIRPEWLITTHTGKLLALTDTIKNL